MPAPVTVRLRVAGDGIVRRGLQFGAEGFEECDDGNEDPADGCSKLVCERSVAMLLTPARIVMTGTVRTSTPAQTPAQQRAAVWVLAPGLS